MIILQIKISGVKDAIAHPAPECYFFIRLCHRSAHAAALTDWKYYPAKYLISNLTTVQAALLAVDRSSACFLHLSHHISFSLQSDRGRPRSAVPQRSLLPELPIQRKSHLQKQSSNHHQNFPASLSLPHQMLRKYHLNDRLVQNDFQEPASSCRYAA